MLLSKYANETDFQNNLASNVAKVTIYYDTLTYSIIKEEAKITPVNLLGNLGGHLHLFLGISFMSIVEIFELLVQLLLYVFFRAKNRPFYYKPFFSKVNAIAVREKTTIK